MEKRERGFGLLSILINIQEIEGGLLAWIYN
jgi:hypothetical protein